MGDLHETMRRAMEAQGKVDPDEVLAQAAEVDLEAPTKPEVYEREQRRIVEEAQQTPLDPSLCPSCEGKREVWNDRAGRFLPCQTCDPRAGLAAGRVLRDEGIARADRAADPTWKERAVTVLNELIESGEEFTGDDVWARVGPSPGEPRALGALFRRAAVGGRIVKTGEQRPSTRPEHHAYPMTVWRRA